MSTNDEPYEFYHYNPSAAAAGVFVGIFALSAAVHGWQVVRKRSWYFIPIVVACLMEVGGYIGRILSSRDDNSLGAFLVQAVLLLVAPAVYAASIYVILGRLIIFVNAEKYSVIPVRWLTKIFVAGDVLSFLAQSAGGGLLGAAKGDRMKLKTGENIILAGLALQILFFGFFIIVIVLFYLRLHKNPTETSIALLRKSDGNSRHTWKGLLYVLYTASGAILIRSLFRVIEYGQGNDGYLLRSEVWLYVFDAGLMTIVSALFNVWHPSYVLSRTKSPAHSRDEYDMSQSASVV